MVEENKQNNYTIKPILALILTIFLTIVISKASPTAAPERKEKDTIYPLTELENATLYKAKEPIPPPKITPVFNQKPITYAHYSRTFMREESLAWATLLISATLYYIAVTATSIYLSWQYGVHSNQGDQQHEKEYIGFVDKWYNGILPKPRSINIEGPLDTAAIPPHPLVEAFSPIKAFESAKNIDIEQLHSAIEKVTVALNVDDTNANNNIAEKQQPWTQPLSHLSDLVEQYRLANSVTTSKPSSQQPINKKEITKERDNLQKVIAFLQGYQTVILSEEIINTLEEVGASEKKQTNDRNQPNKHPNAGNQPQKHTKPGTFEEVSFTKIASVLRSVKEKLENFNPPKEPLKEKKEAYDETEPNKLNDKLLIYAITLKRKFIEYQSLKHEEPHLRSTRRKADISLILEASVDEIEKEHTKALKEQKRNEEELRKAEAALLKLEKNYNDKFGEKKGQYAYHEVTIQQIIKDLDTKVTTIVAFIRASKPQNESLTTNNGELPKAWEFIIQDLLKGDNTKEKGKGFLGGIFKTKTEEQAKSDLDTSVKNHISNRIDTYLNGKEKEEAATKWEEVKKLHQDIHAIKHAIKKAKLINKNDVKGIADQLAQYRTTLVGKVIDLGNQILAAQGKEQLQEQKEKQQQKIKANIEANIKVVIKKLCETLKKKQEEHDKHLKALQDEREAQEQQYRKDTEAYTNQQTTLKTKNTYATILMAPYITAWLFILAILSIIWLQITSQNPADILPYWFYLLHVASTAITTIIALKATITTERQLILHITLTTLFGIYALYRGYTMQNHTTQSHQQRVPTPERSTHILLHSLALFATIAVAIWSGIITYCQHARWIIDREIIKKGELYTEIRIALIAIVIGLIFAAKNHWLDLKKALPLSFTIRDYLIIFAILFGSVAAPLGTWHLIKKNLPKGITFKKKETPLTLLFELGTITFFMANLGRLWTTTNKVKKATTF